MVLLTTIMAHCFTIYLSLEHAKCDFRINLGFYFACLVSLSLKFSFCFVRRFQHLRSDIFYISVHPTGVPGYCASDSQFIRK